MFDLLIKTRKGLENIVAQRVLEIEDNIRVFPKPRGYLGLVLVEGSKDRNSLYKRVFREVVEAEKVFLIEKQTSSKLDEIVKASRELVEGRLDENETFAVRTTRRGSHDFTSLDVNIKVGDTIRKLTNADVNLDFPDKILWVEIIDDITLLTLTSGLEEHKKKAPDKFPVLPILRRMAIVQTPYLGPLKAVKEFGLRIGRCIQTFEVGEFVVAPVGLVNAQEILAFLQGVREGIETRYNIQKRVYARKVHKVPIYLQDLYQLVRDRMNEPLIIFEPEGEKITKLGGELVKIFKGGDRVNLLLGSREGIPSGLYRFATLVVDLCPGVTISTDFAAASAIMALITLLEEHGFLKELSSHS